MPSTASAEEIVAAEENAVYLGVSLLQLMECAGRSIAEHVATKFAPPSRCVIIAGTGRNGGDGMVAARHLASAGFSVKLVLVGSEEKVVDPTAKANWLAVKHMTSIKSGTIRDSSSLEEFSGDVVVDALLGTGVKGKITPPTLQAIRMINQAQGLKVAVDVPSGIDATTGEIQGEAVRADLTLTFHRIKSGLEIAKENTGELVCIDIGIPPEAESHVGPGDVTLIRRIRPVASHKGDFGRVLVIGGSETFAGAPALSGLAALQTGIDLVYVAAPKQTAQTIASFSPNLITLRLEGDWLTKGDLATVLPYIEKSTAVVIGPGLGLHRETTEAVKVIAEVLEKQKKPVVMDADGLKIYSKFERSPTTKWVLTPHIAEYKLLTGEAPPPELEQRKEHVMQAAAKFNAILVLKGNVDIISDGDRLKLNYTGNPGMTVGGTGDTLTGIIAGFLGNGADPMRAAAAGTFINGAAGDLVFARKGFHVLPTDIVDEIPQVLENPMIHRTAVPL